MLERAVFGKGDSDRGVVDNRFILEKRFLVRRAATRLAPRAIIMVNIRGR